MSEHTKGPWQTKAEEVGVDYIRVRGTRLGGRYKVANVICPTSDDRDKEETRANARLIAAAPKMLEACQLIVKYDECDQQNSIELMNAYADALDAARAAIQSAQGNTK
jgi:hypothetical protein